MNSSFFEHYKKWCQLLSFYQDISDQELFIFLKIQEEENFSENWYKDREDLKKWWAISGENVIISNEYSSYQKNIYDIIEPSFKKTLLKLKTAWYIANDKKSFIFTHLWCEIWNYIKQFSNNSQRYNFLLRWKLVFKKYPYVFSIIIASIPPFLTFILERFKEQC